MTSHHLPGAVVDMLKPLARALDDGLQAESYHVDKAMAIHAAFDENYVDSHLTRALVCSIVQSDRYPGLFLEELPNGGCEVRNVHQGVERLFRFKKATRDRDGLLDVRVSTDSLLTQRARAATLFDAPDLELFELVERTEQWVLPYLISPVTRTLVEINAALPIGTRNEHPPFRLIFSTVVPISHAALPPPAFPKRDDNLELGDDAEEADEDGDEAAG